MKTVIYNNAKCGATAWNDDVTYEAPCDFANINDAIAWLEEEIDVRQQAIGGSVYDLETGEIYATCYWDDNSVPEEDYSSWDDDVDESNYDPYAGCDVYEVEPIGYDY